MLSCPHVRTLPRRPPARSGAPGNKSRCMAPKCGMWCVMRVVLAALIVLIALGGTSWGALAGESAWGQVEIVTAVLGAATIVLASLAIILAVAAFWGWNTLKSHAASIAAEAAEKAASEAASRQVQSLLREWGVSEPATSGDDIAQAYEKE